MTDPYQILGVTPNASDDEVKKAYRNLCRKYHPDKNPGNQAAEDMFKIVQEAYDTIMDQRRNGGAAGGYRIQGLASCFISKIEGTNSSVMGLPIFELYDMLKEQNYSIFE